MTILSDHLLSAIVALPLLAAILAMTFPKSERHSVVGFGLLVMGLTAMLAVVALSRFDLGEPGLQLQESVPWIPAWGASYAVGVDGLAMLMVLLTVTLTPLSLWAAALEIKSRQRDFVACLLLLESMILGAFCAVDMLLFYVFWEAMLVPAFMLIGIFGRGQKERMAASLQFFLYTMAGSMVMLAALIYAATCAPGGGAPSFLWTDIVARFASVPVSYTELALFIAFAVAFAIKVPLVPLHGWLPNAYAEAPVAVTVMLSGLMVKVGAFAFLRYSLLLFPRSATFLMPTLMVLAVVGIIYGACLAAREHNLRRLLAYSSISHMGFIMVGLCSMAPDALMGGALQMVSHAVSTAGLFILTGMVLARTGNDAWNNLGGLATRAPLLAAAFVAMACSSMGLPGLSGFVGEFMILLGTFGSEGLAISLSTGAVVQGAIIALVTLGAGMAILALGALARRDHAAPSRLVTALGAAAILALFAGLLLPPVGPLPAGLLLRPLLPHALSSMPCTSLMPVLAALATLGVVLGALYLLLAIERTFFGPPSPQAHGALPIVDLSAQERWLLLPFLAAALALGLYPSPVLRLVEPTLIQYVQQFRAGAQWPPLAARTSEDHLGAPRLVPVGPGHLDNASKTRADVKAPQQRPAP